jgi:phage baseplate assembly protein W|tara:strand:+ start:804 stop:1241 length:438 start_codon:yes stop_codon:yes gene_type:complete
MAKERKEYFYNPIDFRPDVAVGVKLPFGKPNGLFAQSFTTEEQAVSNLKNLLLTRKGERPFQPLFGSDVYSLLFELIDRDIEERMSKTLSDDIKFWLPYIVIDNISIDTNPDRNSVKIQLRFRVTEQGANEQIILFIDSEGAYLE